MKNSLKVALCSAILASPVLAIAAEDNTDPIVTGAMNAFAQTMDQRAIIQLAQQDIYSEEDLAWVKHLEKILNNQANVNDRVGKNEQTILMWAAAHNKKEVVQWLLEKGADVNLRTKYDHLTALQYAIGDDWNANKECFYQKDLMFKKDIVNMLLANETKLADQSENKAGVDVNTFFTVLKYMQPRLCPATKTFSDAKDADQDHQQETAAMREVYQRGMEVVVELLKADLSENEHFAILMQLAKAPRVGVLRHVKGKDGKYATRQNVYNALLGEEINLNPQDQAAAAPQEDESAPVVDENLTEEELAAAREQAEQKALAAAQEREKQERLQKNWEKTMINRQDKNGFTVLFFEQSVPEFLVNEKGADVNIRNLAGKTPLFYREDIKDRLIKLGADINARDHHGMSVKEYWKRQAEQQQGIYR